MNISPVVAGLTAILLAAAPRIAHGAHGEVLDESKITPLSFLDGPPYENSLFGWSVTSIGDLDGDFNDDMAVGAFNDDFFIGAVWILLLTSDNTVKHTQKIGWNSAGGFGGALDPSDRFGSSVAAIGDLDGDSVTELAVGAQEDDDGSPGAGAVWILFMNSDGTVASHQKISATQGGFGAGLSTSDRFGSAVEGLGDLDGDGVEDIAVGANGDVSGRGSIWILFLNANGTVKTKLLVTEGSGGFVGDLDTADGFGVSIAAIGDLDNDLIVDLAVGTNADDDGGTNRGAVWILFLNANGTVAAHQKISDLSGTFDGTLADLDNFGVAVAAIDDLDNDGVEDIAVGAYGDDDGAGDNSGAAWVLFLNTNGTVKNEQKISATSGFFPGPLDAEDDFGSAIAAVGNFVVIAAQRDDDGSAGDSADRGALWVLTLNTSGTVSSTRKFSATSGNLGGFHQLDEFGRACGPAGDIDDDGITDLAVGVAGNDDEGTNAGAFWLLFMNGDGTVRDGQKISGSAGGFEGTLIASDQFGSSAALLGDLDGNGVEDLAVGAMGDDDGAPNAGAVWILFMNADGTVASEQKISNTAGGFGGSIALNDAFGAAVASVGDLDGNGVSDLAVGVPSANDGGGPFTYRGAVWILFLQSDGTVSSEQKISALAGGFTGTLDAIDQFGTALASLGDLDGDGVNDLAVGAPGDDDGIGCCGAAGAVWILFLNANGTVKAHQKISATSGSFGGTLGFSSRFGAGLAALGDLDGDGANDLAVGAWEDQEERVTTGAVWTVFLNSDGTVKEEHKINATSGGFGGALEGGDGFGWSLATLGDLDGDGKPEIAVGAPGDDDMVFDAGALWLLSLDAVPVLNFDPPTEILAAGAGDFIATGDLDSDGDDDAVLVIPGTNPLVAGHVQVFINQGTDSTGGWFGFVANPAIEVGLQPSGVAVGHLDGDEHLDLAVTNAGDGNVTVLLNTGVGDGTFAFDVNVTVGLAPQGIAAANLNGTGFDDVAVANAGSDNVMILTNTTALATTWMVSATIPVGDEPVALEPEDVDNDKDFDLVVANRSGGTATILLLSSGAPGSSQTVLIGGSPVAVATGDIDESGFADIAVANEDDDLVALVPNEGGGVFGAAEPVSVGVAPESVELVDLDGDGDPDLAVVAQDATVGPAVQVLENLGPTVGPLGPALVEFGPPVGHSVEADPNYVVSADIDEDDRIDLVTANDDPGGPTGGSISVLLNLACPADIDSSGDVGFGDLTAFLLNWGPCPAAPANCPWDLDQDDTIGFNDLTLLLIQWGTCE